MNESLHPLSFWCSYVLTMKVTIQEINIGSQVRIIFTAEDKEAITSQIEKYLKDYPYAGYMTHFREAEYDPTHGFIVYGSRLASCD